MELTLRSSDAKIDELHDPLVGHDDVLRRDVAMYDVESSSIVIDKVVRVFECFKCPAHDARRQFEGNLLSSRSETGPQISKVDAPEQLHRDEERAVEFAEFIDLDDVGMIELRGDSRF